MIAIGQRVTIALSGYGETIRCTELVHELLCHLHLVVLVGWQAQALRGHQGRL